MAKVEVIVFQGVKFRRYPDSKNRTERVYFTPGHADRAKGVGRLHEEIWKAAHGPIPAGYHIHHADHDPLNNDLSNLVCIPAGDHHRHHAAESEWLGSDRCLEHLAEIRPKAAEWHRSPEGRAWHSEHARRVAADWQPVEATCEHCGERFESVRPGRFCSNKCKSAWRRAAGVDDEDRTCEYCGGVFRVNRYARTRFCSRSCARRHQNARQASGL